METELKSLEQKISQLVGFCQRLRDENHVLRQELVTEQNQNKHLNDKLVGAKDRLESLLTQIPES
jgi:cell division protein ZapB